MRWRHPLKSHLAVMLALVLVPAPAVPGQEGAKDIRRDRVEGNAGAKPPGLIIEPGGFTGPVGSLAFSPDGRWLAAGGDDKTVRIWEMATDRLVATLRGQAGAGSLGACTALDFSPDGHYLVVGVEDSTPDGTIRVYETGDLTRIAQLLPGHPRGGTARLAFSRDGKYLVSAGADKQAVIWDWATRQPLGQGTFQGRLSYLGFPWNSPVAVAFDEFNFYAWSARDGKDLFAMEPRDAEALFQGLGRPRGFAGFVDELNAIGRVVGRIAWPFGGNAGAKSLFPELGQILAAGRSIEGGKDRYWVGLWSTANGGLIRLYQQHRYLISALALSPDRQLVASADLQGGVHVWDVQSGSKRSRYDGAGHPIYSVGFDPSGRRVSFGYTTYGPERWGYNHYAPLERTFDLENRRISNQVRSPEPAAVLQTGRRALSRLTQDPKSGILSLACLRQGQAENRYTFPPRSQPMCYSFLLSRNPGFEDPIAIGLHNSGLTCRDPLTMLSRRDFLGHQGAVTALSESPDGRFLASSSADRTVRIWSLEHFQVVANVDFDTNFDNVINYLVPGGSAARAGVWLNDRFLKMDGTDVSELTDMFLSHHWRWHVGDRVTLELEREGKPYRTEVTLVPGGDYVEPLLSLYAPTDDDWVLWTPQGYFDCSPGGDRLIGWLVNQGRSKAAQYYPVHQFRERFYRPDIIDQVLQAGDVPRAVEAANAKLRRPPPPIDPRHDFEELKPPRIRILAPVAGTRTQSVRVRVRAVVESPGTSRIGQITVLVNGRQARDKDIARTHLDPSLQQAVDQDVSLVPGHNEIAVLARNEASSETLSAMVALDYDVPKPGRGNLYVLAIGISKYARPEISSLNYADRDAEDFADAWKRQQGHLYDQVEQKVITNQNATTVNIKKGFSWLQRTATENDLAILFLSAHGTLDDQQNYYLATEDTDPAELLATALPHTDVSLALQSIKGRVLVFIDTCHSGGLVPGALGRALHDLYSEKTGAIVFSSCLPKEKSFERDDWGHGAFTKALLEILKVAASDINGDGLLALSELNQRLADRVKELTGDSQHPVLQKPPTIREDLNIAKLGLSGD